MTGDPGEASDSTLVSKTYKRLQDLILRLCELPIGIKLRVYSE